MNAQNIPTKIQRTPLEQLEAYLGIESLQELPISLDNALLFKHLFQFIGVNGKGSFGVVIKVLDLLHNDNAAIKIIPKKQSNSETETETLKIMEEAKMLKSMNHNNVVNFREVYESHDFIFMVMDHIGRGSLSSLIQSHKLHEAECSIIVRHILYGLKYIHSRNYIHRDLKPDNVLLRSNDLTSVVIVDFGMSVTYERGESGFANSKSGTIIYMAPEQAISSNYGQQVDMWALGIITYMLITGEHPLYTLSDTNATYLEKLKNPQWHFTAEFSPLSKDFFMHLCKSDICSRYDALTALNHPWITRNYNSPIPKTIYEQIKDYNDSKGIKALIRSLLFIAELIKKESNKKATMVTKLVEKEKVRPSEYDERNSMDNSFVTMPLLKFGIHKQSVISQRKRYQPSSANKSEIDILHKEKPLKEILSTKDILNYDVRTKTSSANSKSIKFNVNNQHTTTRKCVSYKAKLRNTDCFQLRARVPTFRKIEMMDEAKEYSKNVQALLRPIKQMVKNKSNQSLARSKLPCKHIVF